MLLQAQYILFHIAHKLFWFWVDLVRKSHTAAIQRVWALSSQAPLHYSSKFRGDWPNRVCGHVKENIFSDRFGSFIFIKQWFSKCFASAQTCLWSPVTDCVSNSHRWVISGDLINNTDVNKTFWPCRYYFPGLFILCFYLFPPFVPLATTI